MQIQYLFQQHAETFFMLFHTNQLYSKGQDQIHLSDIFFCFGKQFFWKQWLYAAFVVSLEKLFFQLL